ncbi:NAD-dependent epimerase/dehydratase family protein [Halalkalibacter akibai]|uniref:UDP-glucose 4-epimerase n=1 Tax=Halalkalibacter akibai (strain ATCC 43226 / DSM 21942 / CIP 109018 / JCM 9157 / 1139) TaxID=1236973 RepID=W4QVV1_HALA3|nr:NAD(P)-dependent oxidoreductase [Halalkalibacter akibai]GAE35424.1 UDP-glucose 4-epimerase [Halalkalibacter akibai JCM 9157]
MEKVVVTGGLGFIGFHLVERLLAEGIQVVIIDQISDEKREEQEEKWLRIGRNDLVTLIDENLERVNFSKVLKGVDVVYHLAASTSNDSKWKKLQKVIENNVEITKKIVESIPPKAKLIYSSTVEVYGERPGTITERTPSNPTTPYGITKLASERLIQQDCVKRNIVYNIVRLPTVYGPWQRSDMTYQQILTNEPNPGKDRSTIDVMYVEDCVEAFYLVATKNIANEIFHLATGEELSWFKGLDLLECSELVPKSPIKSFLSPDKTRNILGFVPQVSLEKGLAKQREHVKQWQQQRSL